MVPTVTISTPARAGPTTRALLTTTPLRLTALARSSGGTRRLTKAWREGESAIWTIPPATPMTTRAVTPALPAAASAHNKVARRQ